MRVVEKLTLCTVPSVLTACECGGTVNDSFLLESNDCDTSDSFDLSMERKNDHSNNTASRST